MSFPWIPLLTIALLVCGIGAVLWDLYRIDKERQTAVEAITALLVCPNPHLNKESSLSPCSHL